MIKINITAELDIADAVEPAQALLVALEFYRLKAALILAQKVCATFTTDSEAERVLFRDGLKTAYMAQAQPQAQAEQEQAKQPQASVNEELQFEQARKLQALRERVLAAQKSQERPPINPIVTIGEVSEPNA